LINGSLEHRLPGSLSVVFPGVEAEAILLEHPELGLSVGSACSASHREPSHVLRAIGRSADEAHATLRIGLGRSTTERDVDEAASRIVATVRRLRAESPIHDAVRGGQTGPRGGETP
jgi:cysteine desulfurase